MSHFDLGGSSASRWMNCALSYVLIRFAKSQKLIPKSVHTEPADRGTVVHFMNEVYFDEGMSPDEFLDMTFTPSESPFDFKPLDIQHEITVTEREISSSWMWIDYISERLSSKKLRFHQTEKKSTLHKLFPDLDIGGSADFTTIIGEELTIYDYKNGRYSVEVSNNPQFLIYATGLYLMLKDKFKIRRIRLVVVQPNCSHDGGAIRSDILRTDQLKKWIRLELRPAINRIRNATLFTEPNPSQKACVFCDVKHLCRAHNKKVDVSHTLSPHLLTDNEIDKLLLSVDYDMARLKKFKTWAENKFEKEEIDLPSFELVDYFGNRKITNPKGLIKKLNHLKISKKEYLDDPKLKTITELERNTRIKPILNDYVEKEYKGKKVAKKEISFENDD